MIAVLGLHQSSPREKVDISCDKNIKISKLERMYFRIKIERIWLQMEVVPSATPKKHVAIITLLRVHAFSIYSRLELAIL